MIGCGMECPTCGAANLEGKKFCGDCGTPLPVRCTSCGAENPPGKKFCADCGAVLSIGASRAPAEAASPRPAAPMSSTERRQLTVLFCDLVGSTSLAARLDAEDWCNLVNAYLDEASAAVIGLGGHVLKKLGDGLMALFDYRQAQEDDAERAVRAALAIQRALAEINARNRGKGAPELLARIGIESGPVVVEP